MHTLQLDTFLAAILSSTEVGNLRPSSKHPEGVARIHEVGFFSLNSSAWDDASGATIDGLPVGSFDRPDDSYIGTTANGAAVMLEHPCAPLMKILSSGTFYYALSPQWDISSRLARRTSNDKMMEGEALMYDDRFLWNAFIVKSLLDFRQNLDKDERDEIDRCQFIVSPSMLTPPLPLIHPRSSRSKVMLAYSLSPFQRPQPPVCQ